MNIFSFTFSLSPSTSISRLPPSLSLPPSPLSISPFPILLLARLTPLHCPRGPSGSLVQLLVQRANGGATRQTVTFELQREKVSVNPVSFSACQLASSSPAALASTSSPVGADSPPAAAASGGVVGYIRLTTFNQNSAGGQPDAPVSAPDAESQLRMLLACWLLASPDAHQLGPRSQPGAVGVCTHVIPKSSPKPHPCLMPQAPGDGSSGSRSVLLDK